MSMYHAAKYATAVAIILLANHSEAQNTDSSDKYFLIKRTETAPQIDGRLSESEWDSASIVTDLHQVQPVEFAEPSQRTAMYVTYDDKALYIAARAFDSDPSQIVAQTLRQGGNLSSDDSISIVIDAFNNKRSGYKFTLNANGVRDDGIYATATRLSDDWDGIWQGAANIVDDGWVVEVAIPFNTITFDPENDTWGINFERRIARNDELVAWESRNGVVNPTVSGEVNGLSNLSQGRGIDIIPSLSSNYLNDHSDGRSGSEVNQSLDINYKLTPSISALLTINTDFSATEVDGRQLGIDRFSLFFPEKRSFFLTDSDIFQFGGVPSGGAFWQLPIGMRSGSNGMAFFSRRIGLTNDREPVDIIAGSKVSGRIGNFDFGTLYIKQDEYDDIGASDLAVARISTGVLAESSLGVIATHGDPASNMDSSLVGADFLYRNTRLPNNRTMQGNFWVQKSSNDGVTNDDVAWSAHVGFPARVGWRGGVQIQEVGANFNPTLGFANRTGVRLYGAELEHERLREDNKFIRRVGHGLSLSRWEFLDTGQIQTQELEFELLNLSSNAGDFMRFGYNIVEEGLLPGEQPLARIGIFLSPGKYEFEEYEMLVSSASYRKWSASLDLQGGEIYNGDRFKVGPGIAWTPNERISFELEYDFTKYDFQGQSAITRQITFTNEISFNEKLSLVTLAQYDNLSEDIGINSRLRYNFAAGQDIWFVINHNMDRDPINDRFRSRQTLAAAKIQYTYRF